MNETLKNSNEDEKNGKEAELLFKQYLNNQEIPFYFIDQSKESFSDMFHSEQIHRPDYIVHTKNNVYHIDVKHRKKYLFDSVKDNRFYLNQYEIKGLVNFQNELNSAVWVAFTDILNNPNFFYAAISKIYEYYLFISNGVKNNHPEEYEKYFLSGFIYVPESFLYNCLSFDKGIYKELDSDFLDADIELHAKNSKIWCKKKLRKYLNNN